MQTCSEENNPKLWGFLRVPHHLIPRVVPGSSKGVDPLWGFPSPPSIGGVPPTQQPVLWQARDRVGCEKGGRGGLLSSQPAVGCRGLLGVEVPLTCLSAHRGVFSGWERPSATP